VASERIAAALEKKGSAVMSCRTLEELILSACSAFGRLTEAEAQLVRKYATGEPADFRVTHAMLNHPSTFHDWGSNRVVRASVIVWLCATAEARERNTIRIIGAKIEERLRLDNMVMDVALLFSHCVFVDEISLENAKLRTLGFRLTHVPEIKADGAQIAGGLYLRDGFRSAGRITLNGATIDGDLDCRGSGFTNNGEEDALTAVCAHVSGHVFCGTRFNTNGTVDLGQIQIGGNLDCRGGRFTTGGRDALIARQASVSGSALLSKDFRAEGTVDLEAASIRGNLHFEGAKVQREGAVAVQLASTAIGGNVYLNDEFRAEGSVILNGAKIGGDLECEGGQFLNHGKIALAARKAIIAGYVRLKKGLNSKGFKSEGAVTFAGSTIGGNLTCTGGKFSNPDGDALLAQGCQVTGSVFLDNGFESEGSVTLYGASIGGSLVCDGARLSNPQGVALLIENAAIKGDVLLRHGFVSNGVVRLYGATIGGGFECNGGHIKGFVRKGNQNALLAWNAEVKGNVSLQNGFKSEGKVDLSWAKIGGSLGCQKGEFYNKHDGEALIADWAGIGGSVYLDDGFRAEGKLSFKGARISAQFRMSNISWARRIACLDLRFAFVTMLEHDIDSWPEPGCLSLNGLVYSGIGEKFPSNSGVEWLRLQPTKPISLQSYEQLAKVLKASGDERQSTRVLIAKQDDLASHAGLTRSGKWWNRCIGFAIGHGYRPHRALFGALFFVLLGWVFFGFGHSNGLMSQQKAVSGENHVKFEPLVYSVDSFLPIIDLKEKGEWIPNPNKGHVIIKYPGHDFRWGDLLRIYFWVHTVFGWILTTLWVAGFTGLVRKMN
jgi:NDP-sugar pyrophosphorylase family protein